MEILFVFVIPLLAGKAFTVAVIFWFGMIAVNYITDKPRMVMDSDGVYRPTYTSALANKLAGWTLVIMVLSWIPLFSALLGSH